MLKSSVTTSNPVTTNTFLCIKVLVVSGTQCNCDLTLYFCQVLKKRYPIRTLSDACIKDAIILEGKLFLLQNSNSIEMPILNITG